MDSGTLDQAVDLGREALLLAVQLSLPILLAGLVVGAVISALQAATQMQEQTLNQVPKMFAIAATAFLALPWMLSALSDYAANLFLGMGTWFK
jgi:flagellar biosynthetic protein FliQ